MWGVLIEMSKNEIRTIYVSKFVQQLA